MDHIVRVLTTGKPIDLINQGIVDAIHSGSRVLVKAGSLTANFPEPNPPDLNPPDLNPPDLNPPELASSENKRLNNKRPQQIDSENRAIASWAENLSQQHGLVWQRVGPDVLFTRTNPEILIRNRN